MCYEKNAFIVIFVHVFMLILVKQQMDEHKAMTFSYADIVKKQATPEMVPKQKSPSWFDQIEESEKMVSLVRITQSFIIFQLHSLCIGRNFM